jgi:prepilin-type N-terminal cleavage/methylation domain-containing protein
MLVGASTRGFTLTEVLVVGAIVAIMTAVAVPVYTGYVRNQRQEMVENLAQAAAVAANAYFRRTGLDPATDGSNLGLFFPDPTKYTVSVDQGANTITVRATDDATITKILSYE